MSNTAISLKKANSPDPAKFFERVIRTFAQKGVLTSIPTNKELTTQQVADILNVSHQYFIKLLNEKQIPFREIKTHRYVRMDDLLIYKRQRDITRMALLDNLSQMTQEFGGYEE